METPLGGTNRDIENPLEIAQTLQERLFFAESIEEKINVAETELAVLNLGLARDLGKTVLIVDRILGPPEDITEHQEGPIEYEEVTGMLRGFEALTTDRLSYGPNLYIFLAAEQPSEDLNNPFFYGKRIYRAPVIDSPTYTLLDLAS